MLKIKSMTDKSKYSPATCHLDGKKITDKNKRKCLIMDDYITLQSSKLKEICDESDYLNVDTDNFMIDNEKWELLRYDKDDYFDTHKDRKTKSRHTHVILIYLKSKYTGGELEIHDEKTKESSAIYSLYNTSKFDKTRCIIFPISYYHKANPVLSGTKYVLKNKFSIKSDKPEKKEKKISITKVRKPSRKPGLKD